MPGDIKISELPVAITYSTTDFLPSVVGGVTSQITWANVFAAVAITGGSITGTPISGSTVSATSLTTTSTIIAASGSSNGLGFDGGGANGRITVQNAGGQYFFSGSSQVSITLGASTLSAPAANTLAQRNGTNGQTFAVYATYIDDSNFSRMLIQNTSSTLEFIIDEAGSGVGTVTSYSFDKPVSFPTTGAPTGGTGTPIVTSYFGDPTVMLGGPTGWIGIMVSGSTKAIPYYG